MACIFAGAVACGKVQTEPRRPRRDDDDAVGGRGARNKGYAGRRKLAPGHWPGATCWVRWRSHFHRGNGVLYHEDGMLHRADDLRDFDFEGGRSRRF